MLCLGCVIKITIDIINIMVKTTLLNKVQPTAHLSKSESSRDHKDTTPSMLFFGAVLDMSWQMAVVVLVPIIGGYELDKHTHTTPLFTIIGFILAMVGTFVVIRRMLSEYSDRSVEKSKEQK